MTLNLPNYGVLYFGKDSNKILKLLDEGNICTAIVNQQALFEIVPKHKSYIFTGEATDLLYTFLPDKCPHILVRHTPKNLFFDHYEMYKKQAIFAIFAHKNINILSDILIPLKSILYDVFTD